MKIKSMNTLAAALGVALALASSVTSAESTYGYNTAGTGPVTATAHVNITVSVPLLLLLRVGGTTPVTGDVLTLTGSFASGIPGGPATPTDGNSQAATWSGVAPTFASATTASVLAYAWTNSTGGGKVTCAVTTPFPGTSGLTGASISVASTLLGAVGLSHPGTDTGCTGTTNFARNTLVSSTWAYSLTAAALGTVNPGSNSETVTYTATSL